MYLSLVTILIFNLYIIFKCDCAEVIWAVNCGGNTHVDKYGIKYLKDMHQEGEASDYGKRMFINRVHEDDQILYQTERYHTETFGYNIPIRKDGSYVLVLKFSEVWFSNPNMKVFDVMFNDLHTVISGLDIFSKVGRSSAHDEYVPFLVEDGVVHIGEESVQLNNGNQLVVQFVKKELDNPKINAMYVLRGKLEEVPRLPETQPVVQERPSHEDEDEEEEEEEERESYGEPQNSQVDDDGFTRRQSSESTRKPRKSQRVLDPYMQAEDATTSNLLLPFAVGALAIVPLVFCLCKL